VRTEGISTHDHEHETNRNIHAIVNSPETAVVGDG
jgi:hypothetical protein